MARLEQAKLKNYQGSVEYTDSQDYGARKREWDEAVKADDVPPPVMAYLKENLDSSGRKFELQTVVGDSGGRTKMVHTYGMYSPDGKKQPMREVSIAWDGTMSVDYSRSLDADRPGGAIIAAMPSLHPRIARNPIWSFGGQFWAALDKAIESGAKIDVIDTHDGARQVRFAGEDPVHSGPKRVWVATVDPMKGFSVPRYEITFEDGGKGCFSATFSEVDDGVWFPTQGSIEGFFPDGMRRCTTSMKITQVIANDPNFSPHLFHIDLPKGTHVQDKVAGVAFIVGAPSSTRVLGDYTNVGHVVDQAMTEVNAPAENEAFIPHMKRATEKDSPFVLDLRMGRLVRVDAASTSQAVLDALHGSGIGDLFWDGSIVVVGDSRVELVSADGQKSLALIAMGHGGKYRLPEDVPPPYSLLVTNRTGSRYHLLLKSISAEGISITYRCIADP
jgi:hypothetical protein